MTYDENMTIETAERQRQYVEEQESKKSGLGLVFADAFLRGMRDIGYKNPAWALAEMTDNSVQAQASKIEIVFGHLISENGKDQPGQLAVIDDGVGMIPKMISYAVRWGGTDREDDRHGFGRYGYGLPSSAVSIAKAYSVYSKTKDGDWHRVIVNIDELAEVAGDIKAIDEKLTATSESPPSWVVDAATKIDVASLDSGTIVVLENMDRLCVMKGWKTVDALSAKLREHFGLIYRHWIPEPQVFVGGEEVQVLDPLFLMEHGRFYDETVVKAKHVEARSFTVVSACGTEGQVKIRASYLPPNFQLVDPKAHLQKGKKNSRLKVMAAKNGLHICRDGREIDCVPPGFTSFQIYDRNVKVEIDFDPVLDEFFSITTAKQQIVIKDEMWDRLMNRGNIKQLVRDIRKQRELDRKDLEAAREQRAEDEERASERAMRESKVLDTKAKEPTERQKSEGQRNLEREVTRISETERRSREEVLAGLEDVAQERPFKIEFKSVLEGPFYRPHRLGLQKVVTINTDHPFYGKVYSVAPEVRAGLEVLLFVLAEAELDTESEFETFYKAARQQWSERLRQVLDTLTDDQTILDTASALAATMEVDMAEEVVTT